MRTNFDYEMFPRGVREEMSRTTWLGLHDLDAGWLCIPVYKDIISGPLGSRVYTETR